MTATITRTLPPQRLVTLLNPVVETALRSPLHPLLDRTVLLLDVVGRRTGHRYRIPVSYTDLGDRLVVLTQHAWRRNLRGAPARVLVTRRGSTEPMTATLDENPESVTRTLLAVFERLGRAGAQRRLGIRVAGDTDPTAADLEAAVRTYDLATITLA